MADERIILEIELDQAEAEKRAAELTESLAGLRKESRDLNKAINKNNEVIELLSRNAEDNAEEIERLQRENKGYAEQLVDVTSKIRKQSKEQRTLNRVIDAEVGSLDEVRARLARLTAERNKLKVGTDKFEALQKEIKETNAELSKIEQNAGDFRRNVGNYSSAFDGIGASLKAALGPVAIATTIIAGIGALVNFQQELEETRKKTEQVTGAQGAALNSIVSQVQAISDVFEQDYNEVLLAANAVSKQFGISTDEALEIVKEGFAAGANANGDFLNQLQEYPALMKEVGLNAEQTTALITAQVTEGIYSDKGIDAIKEANIRIREMTPATETALNNIGLSATEIQRQISNGSITTFQAVQKVSARLSELPPQSKEVGAAIADVFGGAGEDAGLQFIETLAEGNLNLQEMVENVGEVGQSELALVEANEKLNNAFNKVFSGADGGINKIKAGFIEFAADAIERTLVFANKVIDLINTFAPLNAAIRFLGDIIKLNFNLAITFGEGVVTIFSSAGKIIKEVLSGNFSAVKDIAVDTFNELKDTATTLAKETAEDFNSSFESAISGEPLLKPFDLTEAQPAKDAANIMGQELGKQVVKGLETGITDAQQKIIDKVLKDEANRNVVDDPIFAEIFLFDEKELEEQRKQQEELDRMSKEASDRAFEEAAAQIEADERKKKSHQEYLDFKKAQREEELSITANFFGALSQLFAQGSAEQKAFATIQATISTYLAAARTLAQTSLIAPPPFPQIAAASIVATGLAQVAQINGISFDDGGNLAFAGGNIPMLGGMITGKSHAMGGVKFAMGNKIGEADGKQGEAYIVNTANNPKLKALASELNVMGGGKAFDNGGAFATRFNDGGIARRTSGGSVLTSLAERNDVIKAIEAMPAPVVSVTDINKGQSSRAKVVGRATG